MPTASTRVSVRLLSVALGSVTALTLVGTTAHAGSKIVIAGTQGPDYLVGTNADEKFYAKAGDDVVHAAGGSDAVIAHAGNDLLWGGSGNDGLLGELGHDVLHGGPGDDSLVLQGHDTAFGGPGNDGFYVQEPGGGEVYGGNGNDNLSVSAGRWLLRGGAGDDVMRSESSRRMRDVGGVGNDQITFSGGPGKAFGGAGDDALTANAGSTATLHGGAGNDVIDAWGGGDPYDVPNRTVCGDGTDTVYLDPTDPVRADCETVFVTFLGTEGDDNVDGTPYNDFVDAEQGGGDTVRTYAGDDFVVLNNQHDSAADTVDLGSGDDQLNAWQSPAIVTFVCGPGNDTVRVDPNDVVADDCETVIYPGGQVRSSGPA